MGLSVSRTGDSDERYQHDWDFTRCDNMPDMRSVLVVIGPLLAAAVLGLVDAVCHEMNGRVNARLADKTRKLQAVREASLAVHDADRNRMTRGRSDPAAQDEFERAWERLRSAQAEADSDRFPRRPKPETD